MKANTTFILKRSFLESYWLSIFSVIGIFGSVVKLYYLEDNFYLFVAIFFLLLLPLSIKFCPKVLLLIDDTGIKFGTYTFPTHYKLIKWEDIELKDNHNIKLRDGLWFSIEELNLAGPNSLLEVDNEITRRLAIHNQTSKDTLSVG